MLFVLLGSILISLLDLAFVPALQIQPLHIFLFFPTVIAWSLLRDGKDALVIAFIGGLIIASFSSLNLGFFPLFFVVSALLASFSIIERTHNSLLLIFLYCLCLSVLIELLILLASWLDGYHPGLLSYFWGIILPSALINATIAIISLSLLKPFAQLIQHSEELAGYGQKKT